MMEKSAQVKFAKVINAATDEVYLQAFVKRASERGVPVTEEDLPALLKTATALRKVSDILAPAIKKANSQVINTALDSLLNVEL
jgi:hypothetical protein